MPTPSLILHGTNATRAKGLLCLWTHFGRFKGVQRATPPQRTVHGARNPKPPPPFPPSFHRRSPPSPRRLTSCHPIKVNSCHVRRRRRRRLVVPLALVAGVAPTPSSLLLSRAPRVSSPNSLLVQIIAAAFHLALLLPRWRWRGGCQRHRLISFIKFSRKAGDHCFLPEGRA